MCSNNLMKESRSWVRKLGAQPVENSFDWLAVTFLSFHTADNVEPIVPLTLHVQRHQSNEAGDLINNFVTQTIYVSANTTCIRKSMSSAMPA